MIYYQPFNINFIRYTFAIFISEPRVFHIIGAVRSVPRPSFQSTDNLLQQSFQFQCRSSVLNFINATGRTARWVDAE